MKVAGPFRLRRPCRGVAIIISLTMVLIMFVLGFSICLVTGGDYTMASRIRAKTQAMYLAQAGLELAYQDAATWTLPHTDTVTLATGAATVTADRDQASGDTLVTSVGAASGVTRTVTARITSQNALMDWREQ